MATKTHIREIIKQRRAVATIKDIESSSQQICDKIIALPAFTKCSWVYAYIDFKNEVKTEGIIEAAWQKGKRVAVPKVNGKAMVFYEITSFEQLKEGYGGILEPCNCPVATARKALMIVPGVAFDKRRHRIGYGGGFYDRYLANYPQFISVAVAFDFQMVDEVPCEEFDIIPKQLITESHTF
jgi:5,10-methenyltetrahydrofolate synthetase